jgi:hypothetical protein
MLRRCLKAVVAGALPILVLLGGCEDHAADVQAVQRTAVRDVAGNGESDVERQRMSLADYIDLQFDLTNPELSWFATAVPRDGSGAPLIEVAATVLTHESRDPLEPDRIVIRFSYDPQSSKVAYLDMAFDGAPAVGDDGKPVPLARGLRSMLAYEETRAEALVKTFGRPLKPNPEVPSFKDVENAPAN